MIHKNMIWKNFDVILPVIGISIITKVTSENFGWATLDYYVIITCANFSKWRRVVFVEVIDEEISNFNKSTVPDGTKKAKKLA